MIMKNKTTRKTLLQMSFQQTNKRGLAYNCEWCGEDSPFIAERYRVDSHIWKRKRALPYHLLPLVQVRFKGSTMPLDGRLAGSLKHAQGTIIR
jgi:hypothetical protein